MKPSPFDEAPDNSEGFSPFAGEKAAPHGVGNERDNDPNANAIEQHATDRFGKPNDAAPYPVPDPMEDGT